MMPLPSKIIVNRFSAMGDVAMAASVLKEFCVQYPDVQLIMVSRPFFQAFFEDIPQITFHPFDPKGKHKGILGIRQLKQELDQYQATAVADLHYNLRSRILGFLFRLSGIRVVGLDKGRKEKKQLTRTVDKVLKPLRQTTERYADVFRKLGFTVHLSHKRIPRKEQLPQMARAMFADEGAAKIGIAPFAQHPYKVFPLAKMGKVIQMLSEKGYETFIFGGSSEEKKIATQWESQFRNVHNTIGLFTLREELAIISNLNLMISMDSSGMHMASLMGIRCLSIWGATHPFAGFLGYGQVLEDCIQVDHPNRPGSVYGNKPCDCDGIEAIDLVTPEMVIDKIGISGI